MIKRTIPNVEVLNATKKSATIASTFSITSNAVIKDKISKIHLSSWMNEKKIDCGRLAIYDDAMTYLQIY